MLTLETMLKAMRQALSYGELKSGAMDFLPAKFTGGYKDESGDAFKRGRKSVTTSGYRRRWDDEKGAYVYTKKD